jgi:hypothetical protein
MPHSHDPRAAQLRRLAELRERQARLAAQRAQRQSMRMPGHDRRAPRAK